VLSNFSETIMKPRTHMLACTASGQAFEEWRRRPVYAAQCRTFAVALELCGVTLANGQGLATRMDAPDNGLSLFRVLRPFRTQQAKALRDRVAAQIKAERLSHAQALATL
jgi:hypothetical protein